MNELVRIGQELKKLYPDYADADSIDLGLAVIHQARLEYPEEPIEELIGVVYERASVDRGMLTSLIERKQSESRVRANSQLAVEADSLRRLIADKSALARQREKEWTDLIERVEARRLAAAVHEYDLDIIACKNKVELIAASFGRDVPTHLQVTLQEEKARIKVERYKQETEIDLQRDSTLFDLNYYDTQRRDKLALKKEEELARIRLEEQERRDRLELDRIAEEDNLEIDFGMRATVFKDHDRIEELTRRIDAKLEEIHSIELRTHLPLRVREQQIKSRRQTIAAYEREKRGLEAGLHKAVDGKKPQGTKQAAPRSPEDPR